MPCSQPDMRRFTTAEYEEAKDLMQDWGRGGPARWQQLLAGALIEIACLRQEVPTFPPPDVGAPILCLVCARERPWSLWGPGGVAVCKACHTGVHLAQTMLLHDRLYMDTRGGTLEAVQAALRAYKDALPPDEVNP